MQFFSTDYYKSVKYKYSFSMNKCKKEYFLKIC